MPEHDSDAHGDIQRMLGTELRDFQRKVGSVHNLLPDAVDFVAEDQGIFFPGSSGRIPRLGTEGIQRDGMDRLFHADRRVPLTAKFAHSGEGVLVVFPSHAFLRPESCLANFSGRRKGAYSTKADLVDPESIAGPESGTDIIDAADVVQDYDPSGFRKRPVFFRGHPAQFNVQ